MFTETWLNNSVPDCAIQLEQLTCYRADRALVEGGKRRGGGLCVYINNVWCRDAVVVCKHCSPLVEFMIIKCRPFYLPREYTAILLVAVYIPPSSNNNNRSEALNDLYQHISEQQTAHPDAFLILAGDFNHADLKSVFPKIQQHVDFPTRGKNTLDFVYTTQRGAYKALPLPHLGASDHITVMLMPAHRPLVKVINQYTSRYKCGRKGRQRHFKTVSTPLTGICLNRLPHTTTPQTSKSTQRLSLPTSPVYWWCNGHKDYHCPGQPEAVADRGGLQTSEGSECCL